jgi:hypothetical protein
MNQGEDPGRWLFFSLSLAFFLTCNGMDRGFSEMRSGYLDPVANDYFIPAV